MPAVKQLQLQRPDGSWGPWLAEQAGLEAYREKLKGHGASFQLRYGLEPFGPLRGLPKTMDTVERAVRRNDQGIVKVRGSDEKVFSARIGVWFTERVPPAPANVSPAIAQSHEFVFSRCEELEADRRTELRVVTMGYTVCKWINGEVGGTPSQHCPGPPSPLGGNAFDFVIRGKDGDNDIAATDIIVVELEAKPYCAEVLWRGVANHFPGHAHCSGAPKRVGIPACL